MLSPSLCPPRAATTSPFVRLTTRTPPAAPPTTASVEDRLIDRDVTPSRLNLASSAVNFTVGVGERGSHIINVLLAQADTIFLPIYGCKGRTFAGKSSHTIRCEFATVDSTRVACEYLHCITRGYCWQSVWMHASSKSWKLTLPKPQRRVV